MTIAYSLTPRLREKLKEPIGALIRGTFNETMRELKRIIEREKPPMIISVGDVVSKNLMKSRILPQLSIIDNKVMRKSVRPTALKVDESFYVKNPPGTITDEAVAAIREALKVSRPAKVVIDGEEDLLTLIAVSYAPRNSIIVYGQPNEGIVVVKATEGKKAEVAGILNIMKSFQNHGERCV